MSFLATAIIDVYTEHVLGLTGAWGHSVQSEDDLVDLDLNIIFETRLRRGRV